jgi:hypothetical protein
MKRTLALLAAGVAGALIALLSLSLVTGAFAQGPAGPTAPGAYPGQMMGRGQMGGQMGGSEQSLVGMAAAELGISQQELVAQLGTGGTIADALRAAGKDPAAFIEIFVASRAERLDAAVAAGTLTREDADARLATARSMAAARIAQPFTARGPGCQDADADGLCDGMGTGGQGAGFVDENGDGVCDLMPQGGQMRGRMGGGRGPGR